VSLPDLLWPLPLLAGLALGLVVRSIALPLLLGLLLVIISFVLFGYSIDHYENGDCQSGAPCPTGEHVIEYLEPGAFILGSTLVIVGFSRSLWNYWSGLLAWRRRRA
jgi:hypothetical protein